MRRLLAILAAIALVVAACGDDDAADVDTTPAATAPDEETSTTTAGAAGIIRQCLAADSYPRPDNSSVGEACANFGDARPTSSFFEPSIEVDHSCLIIENQVTVYPDEVLEDPESFGLRPLDDDDLVESGWSRDEIGQILGYLDEFPLGIYVRDPDLLQQDDQFDLVEADVFGVIDAIEGNRDVTASPHYQLVPADPKWKYGPHSEAIRIDGLWDDLQQTGSNSGGRVVIIDTGTIGDTQTIGIGVPEAEPPSLDPLYIGHGLFAASVVRQFNREVTIDVYRAGEPNGPLSELSVIAALLRADPLEGQVTNLSLGTYPCRDVDPTLGLIQALSLLDGVAITAASGNDNDNDEDGQGNNHPTMFPATLGLTSFLSSTTGQELIGYGIDLVDLADRIVAVGALDRNGDEVPWSNTAEVLSPGADIVGWYHDGDPAFESGLAVWSGTSFAAPHFAACLASGACTPP